MNLRKLTLAWAVIFIAASAFTALSGAEPARYGYLIKSGPPCAVWWAEGAYKVMKDDPVPAAAGNVVRIAAAGNEYEPFLLVLRPDTPLDGVHAVAGPFTDAKGNRLDASAISIRHVAYVKVTEPTDGRGAAGWWPDPLAPYDGAFMAMGAENHPLWITVHVPKDTPAGLYAGQVHLSAGSWTCDVPVELRVRAFSLPERSSVRSSFGIVSSDIKAYHNLETQEELEKVVDLYYKDLKEHRLAPTSPFDLYPMTFAASGVFWRGGEFVGEGVHGGRRALKIVDDDTAKNVSAVYDAPIAVTGLRPVRLTLWARTAAADQPCSVLVEAFDPDGRWIPRANLLTELKGSTDWKQETIKIPALPEETRTLRLTLFATSCDAAGTAKGTAWFDDIALEAVPAGQDDPATNLLPGGDFEMPLSAMKIAVDFSSFDRGARRYLDEFGFNAYDLPLSGLGTGSFYTHTGGLLAGFRQGTPEYDALLSQYLHQVEDHLAKNGWLGREYIYWFDEPEAKDYPFVREGMLNIRKNAPRLTRFITEHEPGPAIMDVSEIGCTIFHHVNPKVVAELAPKGREFWSYLCTGPKAPWVTLFIDHPAVNLRMWLWMSYAWKLKGILVWRANYWNSTTLFPEGILQNPWEDPMSYMIGYGVPYGQVSHWGNGDGRFLYPPNRNPGKDKTKYLCGPVDSVRWEILREGVEDYEYFVLLAQAIKAAGPKNKALAAEASKLLEFPASLFTSGQEYTKDPLDLLRYRSRVADMIEKLTAAEAPARR